MDILNKKTFNNFSEALKFIEKELGDFCANSLEIDLISQQALYKLVGVVCELTIYKQEMYKLINVNLLFANNYSITRTFSIDSIEKFNRFNKTKETKFNSIW